jgi:hypothetical protein
MVGGLLTGIFDLLRQPFSHLLAAHLRQINITRIVFRRQRLIASKEL